MRWDGTGWREVERDEVGSDGMGRSGWGARVAGSAAGPAGQSRPRREGRGKVCVFVCVCARAHVGACVRVSVRVVCLL